MHVKVKIAEQWIVHQIIRIRLERNIEAVVHSKVAVNMMTYDAQVGVLVVLLLQKSHEKVRLHLVQYKGA